MLIAARINPCLLTLTEIPVKLVAIVLSEWGKAREKEKEILPY